MKERAGVAGRFEAYRIRGPVGLKVEDLFAKDETGAHRLTELGKKHLVEQKVIRNKDTKRGLSFMLDKLLRGHTSPAGPYVPTDITFNPRDNPFSAFFVMASDTRTAPTKPGDERVEFDESDGQFDANIPVLGAIAGQGRRSILLTNTIGPGLKRNSIAYPSTNPHREVEYILFAQANVPTFSFGNITTDGSPNLPSDGDTITLDDGYNTLDLTFRTAPDETREVDISGSPSADTMRDRLIEVINDILDTEMKLTASSGGAGLVTLTHDEGGLIGDKAITKSFTVGAWAVPTLSGGGGALEIGSDTDPNRGYIDNLAIQSLGMANGVACGDGEVDSQIGLRSIVGIAPTMVGFNERDYVHEATPNTLHEYVGVETVTGVAQDGYVVSGNEAVSEQGPTTPDADDDIKTATKRFTVRGVDLTKADEGKVARVGSSGSGNNGDYTIATVEDRRRFTVVETVPSDEAGGAFTVEILQINKGDLCFDGDVLAESTTGALDLGHKWRSVDGSGPHHIGRIWTATKSIKGLRITVPAGTPKQNCAATFKIQYLNPAANGGDPRPNVDADWLDVPSQDYTASNQATNIFDAAEAGFEYVFTSPVTTKGIRLETLQADTASIAVEIAELHIFEEAAQITLTAGVDDGLRIAVDGLPTYQVFALGDLGPTRDVDTMVDAINKQVRGWQLEAIKSTHGFLYLRGTVQGDNSQVDLDTIANGSTANTKLGLADGISALTGTSEILRKFPQDALTIIFRKSLSGDLPVA
jgi:hypothetical protein